MLDMALVQSCSPEIDFIIANAIVKTESAFNPFAIGVNKGARVKQPKSYSEAVTTAKQLLQNGANIDLGLAQINSANLGWLGLSVEQVFHPCTNLQAMQRVYLDCFAKAGSTGLGSRMQRALSCYNTGNTRKGFFNGYVNKATNHYNEFVAQTAITPQLQYQQLNPSYLPAYNAINTSTTAVNSFQIDANNQIPNSIQNANMSVSVRPSNIIQLTQTQQLENDLAVEHPIKVFNTWDVFKEF